MLDCELLPAPSWKNPVWWILCLYKPSKCPSFKRRETTPHPCCIQHVLHDRCCSTLRLSGEIWDLPLGCWRLHILLEEAAECVISQMVLGNLASGTYSPNVSSPMNHSPEGNITRLKKPKPQTAKIQGFKISFFNHSENKTGKFYYFLFFWVLLSVLKLSIIGYLSICLIVWEFSLTAVGHIQSEHLIGACVQIPTEQRLLARTNLVLIERKAISQQQQKKWAEELEITHWSEMLFYGATLRSKTMLNEFKKKKKANEEEKNL